MEMDWISTLVSNHPSKRLDCKFPKLDYDQCPAAISSKTCIQIKFGQNNFPLPKTQKETAYIIECNILFHSFYLFYVVYVNILYKIWNVTLCCCFCKQIIPWWIYYQKNWNACNANVTFTCGTRNRVMQDASNGYYNTLFLYCVFCWFSVLIKHGKIKMFGMRWGRSLKD